MSASRIQLLLGPAIVLTAGLALAPHARSQEGAPRNAPALQSAGLYWGANTCSRCHLQPILRDFNSGVLDWCLLTEFSTWRTVDKHSMAYAVLEGPRGREMGEKLGVDVTKPEGGCLSCHAQNFPEQQLSPEFSYKDGVNCEVCHGPSGNWQTPHQGANWRLQTPEQKAELGLWDLRNPEVQSQVCLSCHIGNAELGRVVSHPMYAAGHPPLPSVDVARFVKNIPQHWRSKDDVRWWDDAPEPIREANGIAPGKLYGAELAMVGNIIALRESMTLLAERADLDAATSEQLHRWPELALNRGVREDARLGEPERFPELASSRWPEIALTHSDCLACHHDLRFPGWRQRRGYVAAPGRPMPRSFPLALIDLNIEQFGEEGDRSAFDQRLSRLYEAFAARPFGRADEVRDAARGLASWADAFHSDRLKRATFDEATASDLIRRLCDLNRDEIPDYDTARQIASAIQVIYWDWIDRMPDAHPGHDQISSILDQWDEGLNLGRYPKSDDRDALSLSILRDLSGKPDLDGFAAWTPLKLGFPDTAAPYWEASQNNPIFSAFRTDLDPAQLRDAYVSDQFKEPLQEINNAGLRIALDLASQYDPFRFRAQLESLRSALPPAATR